MRTRLLYKTSSKVCLRHVESQVVSFVGCVGALGAPLVTDCIMDPLDMSIQVILVVEGLLALITGNFFLLNASSTTTSSVQMVLQVFENSSTKLTCYLSDFSVPPFKVHFQIHFYVCLVLTFRALEEVFFIMDSHNMLVESYFCFVNNTTLWTRQVLCVLGLNMVSEGIA